MRLVRSFVSTIALLGAIAGSSAAGSTQISPIAVNDCEILQFTSTGYPFWRPFGPYPRASLFTDGLRIAFVNRASKTATRVAFLVNYRGDVQRVIDAGTFSPNVTIDHTFGEFTGDAWLGPRPNACRAVAIRYTDGSVWRAPGGRGFNNGSAPRQP